RGLEVKRDQRRVLRKPRARRVGQKARDDAFDFIIRLHQALFQGQVRQRQAMVVKIPILGGEISNVWTHNHETTAGAQDTSDFRKHRVALVLGAQMFEKIGGEYDVDTV